MMINTRLRAMIHRAQRYLRAFVTDKHGQTVVVQRPNLAILLWMGLIVFSVVLPDGQPTTVLSLLARFVLLLWAIAEVGWGVNGFRRALGLIILGWLLYDMFW